MDTLRERRLNLLLVEAYEKPPGERRAFLEGACAGDAELLDEALTYLGREGQLGDFLERPAVTPPTEQPAHGDPTVAGRRAAGSRGGERRPSWGSPAPAGGSAELAAGSRVGPYRIVDRLAAGGMGVVYRAEDTRLQRLVALKFLPPDLTHEPEAKSRFVREARAASKLEHSNICTVHEIGETDDGRLYIVMPCYEGESLHERLEGGPLSVYDAIHVARQVAAGLARAHREGIVHRDVKPANVFLAEDDQTHTGEPSPGLVKLLDFGVAKISDEAGLTHPGRLVGTPSYMAPEQIRGEADHRSDVWALGVLLYEMLTGERPFAGPQAFRAVLEDPAPPLAERRPDVPEDLRRVVERAMAKAPEERYQTVEEMAAELPLAEPPAFALPAAAKKASRRLRLLVALLALTLLAAAAATARLYWLERQLDATAEASAAEAPEAVAILPFTVRGAGEYNYLGDGMVDLLATALDGAGDVRAIDPRALLRQLHDAPIDEADPAAGAALARRQGAGLLVLGSVVEVAGRLRLAATLYRVGDAPPQELVTAAAEGLPSEIFSLVDDLAAQLLAAMEPGAGARLRRLAAMTSDSFAALKLYLEGESAWREGHFAYAARAFEAAVDEDPEFALAWYRLSIARNWLVDVEGAAEALEHAIAHGDRLAPDDRRLIEAVRAYNRGDAAAAERLCRDVLSRRPDDVEAWAALGEVEFHLQPLFGRSLRYSRASWERVVELEPEDRQAQLHLARLDLYARDLESLARRSEYLVGLLAGSERAAEPLYFLALLPSANTERRRLRAELKSSGLGLSWLTAGFTLSSGPEVRELWSSLYGDLLAAGRPPTDQAFGHRHLGILALAAGRLEEADRHLAAADHPPERDQEHRALAATLPWVRVPPERLEQLIATVQRWSVEPTAELSVFHPHTRFPAYHRLYVLALLQSRAGHADRAAELADELAALGEVDGIPGLARDLELGVRADVAFRAGRLEDVVELLAERHGRYSYELTLMSPLFSQSRERFLKAEAHLGLGHLREALAWFQTLSEVQVFDLAYLGMSHLRRAEIYGRLGEPERARQHLRLVDELWKDADAQLRELLGAASPP